MLSLQDGPEGSKGARLGQHPLPLPSSYNLPQMSEELWVSLDLLVSPGPAVFSLGFTLKSSGRLLKLLLPGSHTQKFWFNRSRVQAGLWDFLKTPEVMQHVAKAKK